MYPDVSITLRLAANLDEPGLRAQAALSRQRAQLATDPAWASAHQRVADFCETRLRQIAEQLGPRWLRNPERVGKDLSSYIPPQRHPF